MNMNMQMILLKEALKLIKMAEYIDAESKRYTWSKELLIALLSTTQNTVYCFTHQKEHWLKITSGSFCIRVYCRHTSDESLSLETDTVATQRSDTDRYPLTISLLSPFDSDN